VKPRLHLAHAVEVHDRRPVHARKPARVEARHQRGDAFVQQMRVAADVPVAERTALEVLRTDTPAFRQLIEARRNRREEWFKHSPGKVELCNVPLPVRAPAAAAR